MQNSFKVTFRYFGIPEDIVSDWGTQFISKVCKGFMEKLGVATLPFGYQPQASGKIELTNQEVGKFLRSVCSDNQENWSHFLPWAKHAQNSLRHWATKIPSSLYSVTNLHCFPGMLIPQILLQWFRQSEWVWERTQHLQQVAQSSREFADRQWWAIPSISLEIVWPSTQDIKITHRCRKLIHCYIGPYKMLQQANKVTYKLDLPHICYLSSSFHIS